MKSEDILYILMRNDLQSLNAGKAMAQASHASNAFVNQYGKNKHTAKQVKDWQKQTDQGFGTVLVLSASADDIIRVLSDAREANLPCEAVTDPTYPYQTTGEIADLIPTNLDSAERTIKGNTVTLYRKQVTCAYVFGNKETCKPIVGHLPLHP